MTTTNEPPRVDAVYAHLTRQLDLIPTEKLGTPISVIGAGAVGSVAVLGLAKMGFDNIEVFDDDEIEIENMNCQFYRRQDIARKKVAALHDIVHDFTGVNIVARDARYEKQPLLGIVVAAVDSMTVRAAIWQAVQAQRTTVDYLVDPRMGAETALLYTTALADPARCEAYGRSLYTDTAAVQERCTAKATMYTALALGGLVAQVVKDLAVGGPAPTAVQWSLKDYDFLSFGVRAP